MAKPVTIHFNEAIFVAVVGLVVNLSSAALLKEHHTHEDSDCADHHTHHDHNLRAAYLHVIADALTSILAIAALVMGKFWGWAFMDPMMGIVGAAFIIRWSYGLLCDSSRILLDYDEHGKMASRIRKTLEQAGEIKVNDLHVWRLGPGHYSAVVAVSSGVPVTPEALKASLCGIPGLSHVIIEVDVD